VSAKILPKFKVPSRARSKTMRAVRATRNKTTERKLAALMASNGIRGWRLRPRTLPGTPDFVFSKQRLVIFSDGCYWHGHPNCVRIPKTNVAYWRAKIERNRKRDIRISVKLRSLGYTVLRIWECQLRRHPARCLRRIDRALSTFKTRRTVTHAQVEAQPKLDFPE